MSDKKVCCTAGCPSSVPPLMPWSPGCYEDPSFGPIYSDACSRHFSVVGSLTPDANGFYPGAQLSRNVYNFSNEYQGERSPQDCAQICENDPQCVASELEIVKQGQVVPSCFTTRGAFYSLDFDRDSALKGITPKAVRPKPSAPNLCNYICDLSKAESMPQWCKNHYQNKCQGQNLESSECKTYCSALGINCDSALQNYCQQQLTPDQALKSDVCGCFMPSSFYDNYFQDLQTRFNLPLALMNTQPICTYPKCSGSSLLPYSPIKQQLARGNKICPDLVNCFVSVSVNNQGEIVGPIDLSQSAQCSSLTSTTDVTPNDFDSNQNQNQNQNQNSNENSNEDADSQTLSPGIIALIVLVVLAVVGLIIYLVYNRYRGQKPQ